MRHLEDLYPHHADPCACCVLLQFVAESHLSRFVALRSPIGSQGGGCPGALGASHPIAGQRYEEEDPGDNCFPLSSPSELLCSQQQQQQQQPSPAAGAAVASPGDCHGLAEREGQSPC